MPARTISLAAAIASVIAIVPAPLHAQRYGAPPSSPRGSISTTTTRTRGSQPRTGSRDRATVEARVGFLNVLRARGRQLAGDRTVALARDAGGRRAPSVRDNATAVRRGATNRPASAGRGASAGMRATTRAQRSTTRDGQPSSRAGGGSSAPPPDPPEPTPLQTGAPDVPSLAELDRQVERERDVPRPGFTGADLRSHELSALALRLTEAHGEWIPHRFPDKRQLVVPFHNGEVRFVVHTDTWPAEGSRDPTRSNVYLTVERRDSTGRYRVVASREPGYGHTSDGELRTELVDRFLRASQAILSAGGRAPENGSP